MPAPASYGRIDAILREGLLETRTRFGDDGALVGREIGEF